MNPLMIDNLPRSWPGQKPFYEVYFLKFHLLEQGIAFWIRYTLHEPLHGEATGGLWGFVLEEQGSAGSQGALEHYPMREVVMGTKEFYVKMGQAEFAEGRLFGKLLKQDFSLEWDLHYEPLGGIDQTSLSSLKLYPYEWMYRLRFPKTKYLVPYPSALFSGRMIYQGREYLVEKAPGEQAHIWGRQHAERWAWVHCNTFLEDRSATIEGLSAQIKIGPFSPPPFRLFSLRLGGDEYAFNSPACWFRAQSAYGLASWDFDTIQGSFRLMGTLTQDPLKAIGVRYTDPDGSFRYCHHAEWAELRLGLYRNKKGRWEEMTSLHSRAATYEVVDLVPDPQVEFKVLG